MVHSINIAILASGSGTNYDAIYDACCKGKLKVNIVGVITNNSTAPVRAKAIARGHTVYWIDHRTHTRKELDQKIVEVLRHWDTDLVVFAGWMRIVTNVLVDAFPDRILNIHPSLLPSFKGHKAVPLALEAGVKVTGCTVHLVTEEVDSGRILSQKAIDIRNDDTVESLHNRIKKMEYELYYQTINQYAKEAGKFRELQESNTG